MKMTSKLKEKLLFLAFYTSLMVCITGSIFGTYAWYQYSSRAGIAYEGTAIGDSDSIQVGLFSENKLSGFASKYGFSEDITSYPGSYVYWNTGENVSAEALSEFEGILGYSANEVGPCTSGSYVTGDSINLKAAPMYLETAINKTAKKDRYTYLPLVFKGGAGRSVYIESLGYECDSDVGDAFRIAVEDPNTPNASFIMSPSRLNDVILDVAGNLNLNKDGYYDFQDGYECIYGEYTNKSLLPDKYDGSKDYEEDETTTFNANHHVNVRGYSFTPKTAEYLGTDTVLMNKSLATIGTNGVGRANIIVYLEGWDKTCVDSVTGSEYNLNLTFSTGGN